MIKFQISSSVMAGFKIEGPSHEAIQSLVSGLDKAMSQHGAGCGGSRTVSPLHANCVTEVWGEFKSSEGMQKFFAAAKDIVQSIPVSFRTGTTVFLVNHETQASAEPI